MNLTRSQLASAISSYTYKKGVTKPLAKEVANILLKTKKTGSLNSLLRDIELNWAKLGYVDVIARSAYPLSPQVKTDIKNLVIKNYPNTKNVKIIESLDASVVAGVVLEFPDKQLDITIATKMAQFKNYAVSEEKG
jgi:F0F1-type ATP synthase delta subunit